MKRRVGGYTVLVEKDEDGFFVGEVLGLPGCHTQAKDLNTLMERVKEAIEVRSKA